MGTTANEKKESELPRAVYVFLAQFMCLWREAREWNLAVTEQPYQCN